MQQIKNRWPVGIYTTEKLRSRPAEIKYFLIIIVIIIQTFVSSQTESKSPVLCQTVKHILKIVSPSGSGTILVFPHQTA